MEEMTLKLTSEDSAYIKRVVSIGAYESASDFVGQLVADARKKRWQSHVEKLLDEGLSEEAVPLTDEFWDELLREHDAEVPEQKS